MTNVLFLGGGRRNTLAEKFIDSGFNVFSYETDEVCPISDVAEVIKGFRWKDKNIHLHLREVIADNNISIVIPLQDQAVPLASTIKESVCSPFLSAETCFDKFRFQRFMQKNFGDLYPRVLREGAIIEKSRFGYGSKDIKIYDEPPVPVRKDYIYQSYKDGLEYTVDCYFNKESNYILSCPRIRIRTSGGEVVDSKTEENSLLSECSKVVGEKMGLIGPICMQYIVENGKPFLFEINARFGGGSTFSMHSGLDMIDMIKTEYLLNQKIDTCKYNIKYGTILRRSFRDHYYEPFE